MSGTGVQEMTHHCPGWQEEGRTGLPQLTPPPHTPLPLLTPVCLHQEEGQESQPEVEEVEDAAAVFSPMLVCPAVSCPI